MDICRLDPVVLPGCEWLAGNVEGTSYTGTSPDRANYYWVVACNRSGCFEIDEDNPARLNGPSVPDGLKCSSVGRPVDGSLAELAVSNFWDGAAVRLDRVPSQGPRPTNYNIHYEVRWTCPAHR